MNGLNLPTDNLYKFIALAGLALIFFSLYFIFTRLEQGTALRNQLEIDSASINAESERIEFEWEMLKQKVGRSVKALEGPEAKALANARDEINDRKRRIAATAQNATRFIKLNMELVQPVEYAIYFGIGLSAVGFFLWWFKVQRHMDKALREQNTKSAG